MRTWPALDVGSLTDSDAFEAALLDHRVSAIEQTATGDVWRVFFAAAPDRQRAAAELARQFPSLSIVAVDVPDDDWVSRSQESLRAVRVGSVIVAPPWDVPSPTVTPEVMPGDATPLAVAPAPLVVIIRPSMGFGTGHHATSRLCLHALQQLDLRRRRVLDIGTGSGLLAIAARKLGAAEALGLDCDPDAIAAAEDNRTLNAAAGVAFQLGDVRTLAMGTFDVLTANLTGALLQDAAGRLGGMMSPGADLVVSGFVRDDESAVVAAYPGLTVSARAEEDEWVCVTLHRPRAAASV